MALQPTNRITGTEQIPQAGPYHNVTSKAIETRYLPEAQLLKNNLQTPPTHQFATRIQSNTPTKSQEPQRTDLKLHPEAPPAESYKEPVRQAASIRSVLTTIAKGLKGRPDFENLVKAIKDYVQEQNALEGVAV